MQCNLFYLAQRLARYHSRAAVFGDLPGISKDGSVTPAVQRMIDGLRGKVSYWNWNYAPMDNDATTSGGHQYVTKDFTFMPMNWGVTAANPNYLREAGAVNFEDSNGVICPATMADVLLGANEPDIYGSCMGSMCGRCTGPCKPSEVPGDCPVAICRSARIGTTDLPRPL